MLDVAQCGARWCKRSDCRPLLWHRAIHSQDTGELLIQGGLKRSIVAAVTWRIVNTGHVITDTPATHLGSLSTGLCRRLTLCVDTDDCWIMSNISYHMIMESHAVPTSLVSFPPVSWCILVSPNHITNHDFFLP
ncbi:hypothetical protein J6590_086795 [Homalodisca vitripennis]|nr:hypothetical protein J6590_086795 [Homalodisca vitripennis]